MRYLAILFANLLQSFIFTTQNQIRSFLNFFPIMGKGDKRSKKGKIWRGSYGNSRPSQKQQDKKKNEKKKNE
jgi:30S ribosomal protein S31